MSDCKYAYTAKEYCDMILICGECGGDAALAIETYKEKYGEKRHCPTDPIVIIKAIQRIRQNKPLVPILEDNEIEQNKIQQRRSKRISHIEKKNVQQKLTPKKKSKRRKKEREKNSQPVVQDDNTIQRKIITHLRRSQRSHPDTNNEQNPRTCSVQNDSPTDQEIVPHLTKTSPLYSNNKRNVPKKPPLLPRHKPIRFTYCNWLLRKSTIDFDFLSNVMWTGQTKFTYGDLSMNVWAAVHRERIVGPVFIDDDTPLLKILYGPVRDYIDELPVVEVKKLWYQIDLKEILDIRFELNKMFGKQLICRFGPVRWPQQSKDLSPVHFFLWKFIKSKISKNVNSIDDLKKNMVEAFDKAKEARDELEKIRNNILQRAKLCCLSNGNYVDI